MYLPVVAVEGERSLWCGRCAGLEIVDAAFVNYNVAKRPCEIGKKKIFYIKNFKAQCFHTSHSQTRVWFFFFFFSDQENAFWKSLEDIPKEGLIRVFF